MDDSRQHDEAALEQSVERGHEVRDVNYRGVVIVGIGLLLLTGLAMAMTYWFAIWRTRGLEPLGETASHENAASPMFDDGSPAKQRLIREQQEAQQREQLASYGWVQSPNFARIPIDRAIDLLAESGSLSPEAPPAAEAENGATENVEAGN